MIRSLCRWFAEAKRDLPWRHTDDAGRRDPYRALVSEIMLQQTQVSRVVEKFEPFVERFATLEQLAQADESDVLALWSGLGYYRRARGLHAAAKEAVAQFGGLPTAVDDLLKLPGIGRYTAGAIASIVHDQAAPIVDGNVARVVLRVEGRDLEPASSEARTLCWDRATAFVELAHVSKAKGVSPAVLNEAMMELGALICTPKNPKCDGCPIRGSCAAFAAGRQHEIPRPKRAAKKQPLHIASLRVIDDADRLLIEQRPDAGLWAGLWQPPSLESTTKISKSRFAKHFGLATRALIEQDSFPWETSHRSIRFTVYETSMPIDLAEGRRWVSTRGIDDLGLGSPQRRALLGAV